MHLNKLNQIKAIKGEKFKLSAIGKEDSDCEPNSDNDTDEEGTHPGKQEESKEMAAFDIDCKVKAGRLAILYRNGTTKPQVWFQDNSCKWFFVANTFTDYFRLMIMHLGLPHWQYAFTQVGLDAQTLQWFRFLSPERLAIDIENRRQQEAIARK